MKKAFSSTCTREQTISLALTPRLKVLTHPTVNSVSSSTCTIIWDENVSPLGSLFLDSPDSIAVQPLHTRFWDCKLSVARARTYFSVRKSFWCDRKTSFSARRFCMKVSVSSIYSASLCRTSHTAYLSSHAYLLRLLVSKLRSSSGR